MTIHLSTQIFAKFLWKHSENADTVVEQERVHTRNTENADFLNKQKFGKIP